MGIADSLESALLLQIGALEEAISSLSAEIAGLHLRREAARIAGDPEQRDRCDEGMRAVEARLSRFQDELMATEKRFHSLTACGP